jgi:hypothetical protein
MAKSRAQIRRLEKRAAARGEVYVPPIKLTEPEGDENNDVGESDDGGGCEGIQSRNQQLCEIDKRLQKEIKEIDENEELNSKDRRSAKRKAEAVAAEDAGMSRTEFVEWCAKKSVEIEKESTNSKCNKKSLHLTAAAENLVKQLETIDKDADIKSKDRRSAKRKANAIAAEETGMDPQDLLEWYKKNSKRNR